MQQNIGDIICASAKGSLSEMFNLSASRFAERRCQWYQPDLSRPTITTALRYADIFMKVKELSAGLMSLGLHRQNRIAIVAPNCPQWLWCDLAIMGAGAVTVGIFPSSGPNETKYILQQSGSRMIFVHNCEDIDLKTIFDEIPMLEKAIIMMDHGLLPSDERIITLTQLCEKGRNYLSDQPWAYQRSCEAIEPLDPAAMSYMPAFTEGPKFTILTHQNIIDTIMANAALFNQYGSPVGENDVLLSFLPPANVGERCGQMHTIFSGGTIAYPDQSTSFLRDFNIYQPTWFYALPETFEKIFQIMEKAYSTIPEGKAMFEIAIEIGLEMLKRQTKSAADPIDPEDNEIPEELYEKAEWADERIFSRFKLLFGDHFRFAVCTFPGLSSDLSNIYLSMGINIFNISDILKLAISGV